MTNESLPQMERTIARTRLLLWAGALLAVYVDPNQLALFSSADMPHS